VSTPAVVSINLHERHGDHPRSVPEASGRVGGGIEGDSHVHRDRRGVVVVDRSVLDELGLAFGDLREQITVDGLPDVSRLAEGTELRVGGLTLRVNAECEPCTHIGDLNGQPDAGAFRARLAGRRGASCTVIKADGRVRVGDPVSVLIRA
jgi:MOSC domain-containing protein YiiM